MFLCFHKLSNFIHAEATYWATNFILIEGNVSILNAAL